jgi:hypothetical protein
MPLFTHMNYSTWGQPALSGTFRKSDGNTP